MFSSIHNFSFIFNNLYNFALYNMIKYVGFLWICIGSATMKEFIVHSSVASIFVIRRYQVSEAQ